jgi:hypothetical protein
MNFSKRKGDLPVQLEGDAMDIRGRGHTDLAPLLPFVYLLSLCTFSLSCSLLCFAFLQTRDYYTALCLLSS